MKYKIIGFDAERNEHVVEWSNGSRGVLSDGPTEQKQIEPTDVENKAIKPESKKRK